MGHETPTSHSKQFVLPQPLKYLSHMHDVLLEAVGENQNVVQVHEHRMIQKVPQNIIHQGLEDGWGITKPKWHH